MKAVIFDLDGLLVDTEIISYKIYQELLKEYHYEFTIQEYAQKYSGKTEIWNMNHIINEYQLPFDLESGLKKVVKLEAKYIANGIELKPYAKEVLNYLKENHYKIALASSSTPARAFEILESHGVKEYFDSFTFGNEVFNGKPNPDIFLKACEKLMVEPKDCLVLEDSEAGIQAAYSANIPVICIPDMKLPSDDFTHKTLKVFDSLNDVITFLKDNI